MTNDYISLDDRDGSEKVNMLTGRVVAIPLTVLSLYHRLRIPSWSLNMSELSRSGK
jgi:hypothetical protein